MTVQDEMNALSRDEAFTKALYAGDTQARARWDELNRRLAAETSTASLADTATEENVAEARKLIAERQADPEFVKRLQARDPEALQDWKDLHEIAATGVPGSRGRASLVR